MRTGLWCNVGWGSDSASFRLVGESTHASYSRDESNGQARTRTYVSLGLIDDKLMVIAAELNPVRSHGLSVLRSQQHLRVGARR